MDETCASIGGVDNRVGRKPELCRRGTGSTMMPVIQPITVLISKVRLTDIISVEQPQAHVKARHGLEEPGMLPANSPWSTRF